MDLQAREAVNEKEEGNKYPGPSWSQAKGCLYLVKIKLSKIKACGQDKEGHPGREGAREWRK
jgi:hypothetical protein